MTKDLTINTRLQADTSDILKQLKLLSTVPVTIPVNVELDFLNLESETKSIQDSITDCISLAGDFKDALDIEDVGGATKPQPSPISIEYTHPDAAETHRKAKPDMAA